jgi:AraC-like DNA-binding protein
MARSQAGCAACLRTQRCLANSKAADSDALSYECFAGLCDSAVPLRLGGRLAGFLQTGQVALRPPTAAGFSAAARCSQSPGIAELKKTYFQSPVLPPRQYKGILNLLEIFAGHLSLAGNALLVRQAGRGSSLIARARAHVEEHSAGPVTLDSAARALHVSACHLCKTFRRAAGMTFTDYLGRVRVEKAKALLPDPVRRVSEIAYEVGFGSLTHFNRTFRRLSGQSPTAYRRSLPS